MRKPAAVPSISFLALGLIAGACIAIPEGQGIPERLQDQDAGSADAFVVVDASSGASDAKYEISDADPHLVIGVDPAHGPFIGGRRVMIRGNGFSSNARVWFGSEEVASTDVVPADPTRIQVVTPAGAPGAVDVTVQNGSDTSTKRLLPGGFTYDAFYADPDTSPTSGGVDVELHGKETSWTATAQVLLGGKACADVQVLSATRMRCVAPAQPPGAVSVTISADGQTATVDGAFTYTDSDNGFQGGLSGSKLSGTLKVSAFHAYTGDAIAGAFVIAGDSLDAGVVKQTDSSGIALFSDPGLVGARSVTIAKQCFQPTTFMQVTVDTVTAYLSPILSPDCGADAGEVPPVGGKGSNPATVRGELLWTGGAEFQRPSWNNVPLPQSDDEKRVAYLFSPHWDPTASFVLPDSSVAITPESEGSIGYEFNTSAGGGNITLYALAGIENRAMQPASFTAYSFGVGRGISTAPGQTTGGVYIRMDKQLDQAVALSVHPPAPGPRGPDRLISSVSVTLGSGYAIFPNARRSSSMANTGPITFVGLPGLDGALGGSWYVSAASAVTGANAGAPLSIVGKYLTMDASIDVVIDEFVQVPVLTTPALSQPFDGRHLEFSYASGGAFVDLSVIRMSASGGLVEWVIAAPHPLRQVELPDLAALGIAMPSGPLSISVYGAHVGDDFDYGSLRYKHLYARGWTAYSYDVFNSHL